MTKVVVALSGGVDSSAAALLAKRAGYEVVGATLDLEPPEPEWRAAWSCGGNAHEAVGAVVKSLAIEHHYLPAFERFESGVLQKCFEEVAAGRTPNPCALCNPLVKFGILAEFARKIGAEKLLTGHYVKLTAEHLIERGDDAAKDQSYFLARLPREFLAMLEFPVGALQKSEVRALAEAAGLPTAKRPDSQDVCFQFAGETFADTLFRRFHGKPVPGVFRYNGKTVGKHPGLHRYTLGQRKGLQVALGVPAFVQAIHPDGAIDLVTDQKLLESAEFSVREMNWQCEKMPAPTEELQIQIRYRTPAAPGRVAVQPDGTLQVKLNAPCRAITPGQIAAFYRGKTLLGGGVIEKIRLCHSPGSF